MSAAPETPSGGLQPGRRTGFPSPRIDPRAALARAAAAADTPWLLLLTVPVLSLLKLVPGLVIPAGSVVLASVWLGSLRWGLDSLRPTLALCLLCVVGFDPVPQSGNLFMIPWLLLAARLGAEPSFAASILRWRRLAAWDYPIILGLLTAWLSVSAFAPAFRISAGNTGITSLFAAALIGASQIPARPLLVLLATALASLWVFAPFGPQPSAMPFLNHGFGMPPVSGLTCAAAFAIGRLYSRPVAPNARLCVAATGVWTLLLILATANLGIRWPSIQFFPEAAFVTGFTPSASAFVEPIAPVTLVALAALAAWRLAPEQLKSRIRSLKPVAATTLAGELAIVAAVAFAFAGLNWEMATGGWIVGGRADVGNPFILAARIASLTLISALAIFLATRLPRTPSAPSSPPPTGSLFLALLGPLWSRLVVFFLLATGALAIGSTLARADLSSEIGNALSPSPDNSASTLTNEEEMELDNISALLSGNDVEPVAPLVSDAPDSSNLAY
ncbi:MAG TPA: hypothetical protein VFQ67_13655 [Allosphingosinicella sp.]|jgi:hypothetical protein|nr:hypothetical protein [Allosphingosinicella sp.]